MSAPDVSVVLVAWNSSESLPTSLEALRRSAAAAGVSLEIVVVDNASHDDSIEVASAGGADRIVRNPLNAGYVAAACQGIALSRAAWVMLANPDLTVSEGFVGAMLAVAGSSAPDVACLVPDIRYAANPSVVNSRGLEVDELGIPAESDAGRLADVLVPSADVFGPSTSGCLIRRSALAEVGGLEPLYFAYLEDVDLAWRLRKRGYRSLVVPDAVALHQGSASTGEGSWLKAFLVARNRRVLFRLHGPRGPRIRLLRTITEIGHATVQAMSGSGTASVHGRGAALQTRRYTSFLRASNRALATPDDALVTLAPRKTLQDALRRKRAAASLMTRDDGLAPPSRVESPVRRHPRAGRPAPGAPLQVLVDATNLKPGQGGIRTYTIGLIQALAAEPSLALSVATSVGDVAALGPMELVRVDARTQGVVARALWRERHLARLARTLGADIVLTPVPELPLRRLPVPSVVVVHDVGPLIAPEFYSLPKKLRYQAFLPRTCRQASAVVCVSEATLADLLATTRTDPSRCEVIGEGPQLLGLPEDALHAPEPYVLYVGSLDARKNVGALVAAWRDGEAALPAELVLVGPAEERERRALVSRLGSTMPAGRVRHLGFVDSDALTALYREATAVVLPSLYEGFGLPVLEAMKWGVPVVASDIPSVREIAGDAALYVSDPLDPGAWREALARVCAEPDLRADLVRRGEVAAERFSWSAVGERFAELLRHVASGHMAGVAASAARASATSLEESGEEHAVPARVASGRDRREA